MPALRFAVNTSILFPYLPVGERSRAAAEAGFGAVESWWPFAVAVPADREADAFVRSVEDAGVRLVQLNSPAGDMAAGERGLVSVPAARIGHVQVADAPGRGAPGTGTLPLERRPARLAGAGHAGRPALQHHPSGADPFAWLPRDRRRSA